MRPGPVNNSPLVVGRLNEMTLVVENRKQARGQVKDRAYRQFFMWHPTS